MAGDAIINFSNAVLSDAEEKRRRFIRRTDKKNEVLLNQKRRALHDKYMSGVTAECQAYSEASARETAAYMNDLKRELILRRSEMTEDVFSEVEKNIRAYAETEGYRNNMLRRMKKAAESFGGAEIICLVRKADMDFVTGEMPFENMIVKETAEDIIGGFTMSCSEKRLFLDSTLKSGLERQRELFLINSGLVIE